MFNDIFEHFMSVIWIICIDFLLFGNSWSNCSHKCPFLQTKWPINQPM